MGRRGSSQLGLGCSMEAASLCCLLCQLVLSVQVLYAENRVSLLNPPEEAVPDHRLKVQYSCDGPGRVHLRTLVSFESGSDLTLDLTSWSCVQGPGRTRTLTLGLPDWLVYRPDGTVRLSQWVRSCLLRVSLTAMGADEDDEGGVVVQDEAYLEPKPIFSRPFKQHKLCFSWSGLMLKGAQQFDGMVCPVEEETVSLLSSVFASTGEHFGVTRTLQPFHHEVLEHLRLKAISFVWCRFSLWLFVTASCRHNLCSVFHHIDLEQRYVSPGLFLTPTGHLHVQMSGEQEQSGAFLCPFRLPLRRWCQLTLELRVSKVDVSMVCAEGDQRKVHTARYVFGYDLEMDDTDGYFVIGGSNHAPSVEGFFGPVLFHRKRIPEPTQNMVEVPHVIHSLSLDSWLQKCDDFQHHMSLKIREYLKTMTESCTDVYLQYMKPLTQTVRPQCEDGEAVPGSTQYAAKVAKSLVSKKGHRVSVRTVGRALYRVALQKLSVSVSGSRVQKHLPLLQQAGCLQEPSALHLSAALYSAGLGVRQNTDQSWLLSLLSAQRDHRLSLLRLGFLHLHGLSGLPRDPDLAYAYYSNIAQQTVTDRLNPSPQQTTVEKIHLIDQEVLKQQTREDHHIFQWLQFQAQKGEAEAEQTMGQMLFWGLRGVASDPRKAARHYQRGAELHADPVSMYDYGIVLLQGHGVEKDIPKGVFYLKKAMDKGSVPAMNALGWYYENFEKNYQEAVQLWERADRLGSPDAAMNLGVMYLQGLYPNKPQNQFLAYQYFLKSADRGHIKAATQVAMIWTTGIPARVDRRPLEAVKLTKWASEHNGHLGHVLRKGLDSYLKKDMLTSVLFYLMAAESGFAAAQFNLAFLCEQDAGQFLHPDFVSSCMWKYYNVSTHSESPQAYALIKLGDMLYQGHEGRRRDVESAARMYAAAALRDQPQGVFNLGTLVEEGHELPLSILHDLGLSALVRSHRTVILKALYEKCRDWDDTDSFVPCSLTLFNVYLQELREDYSASIKYWSVLTIAPTLYLLFRKFVSSNSRTAADIGCNKMDIEEQREKVDKEEEEDQENDGLAWLLRRDSTEVMPMDTNITQSSPCLSEGDGKCTLEFSRERVFEAASCGDASKLQGLLDSLTATKRRLTSPEFIDQSNGKTVLLKALLNLKEDRNDTIEVLLDIAEKSGDLQDLINASYTDWCYKGQTALHVAIERRSLEHVKLLVQKGANIQAKANGKFFQHDEGFGFYFGELPLSLAACTNQPEVVSFLLDNPYNRAKVTDSDSEGNSVLHALVVIADNSPENTDMIANMDKLIGLEDIQNNQGLTPLKLAAKLGKIGLLKHMLNREFVDKEFRPLSRKFIEWVYGPVHSSLYDTSSIDTDEEHSVLEIIVFGSQIPNRIEMLQLEPLRSLLKDKWERFASKLFLFNFVVYMVYLSIFTAVAINRKEGKPPFPIEDVPDDYLRSTGQIISVLGALWFFYRSVVVFRRNPPKFSSLYTDGFSDIIFFIQGLLIVLCVPLYVSGLREYVGLQVISLALAWLNILHYARGIKQLGIYNVMVQRMILRDILHFLLVYAVFLFGFSAAIMSLIKDIPPEPLNETEALNETEPAIVNPLDICRKPSYTDVRFTILELFKFTIGMGDLRVTDNVQYKEVFYFLLILYIVLTYILLLNMLIAIMGNTVERISSESENIWNLQRSHTILDMERTLPNCMLDKLRSVGSKVSFKHERDKSRRFLRVTETYWTEWRSDMYVCQEEDPGNDILNLPSTGANGNRWHLRPLMDRIRVRLQPQTVQP
uniref:Ion transport domain-containing protein n=1 Tax=Knipowitschia caucasica TaxID=637954 RepID=A0AAV2J577_KNICA